MSLKGFFILIGLFSVLISVQARIELVTLPQRNEVKLCVYNSRDLTLVKDKRILTFKKGSNKLEFSWANTLIDPTSLLLTPKLKTEGVEVMDISYPPNISNTLVWNIQSDKTISVPVEVSYFTSGIKWEADHQLILDEEQTQMEFHTYVSIDNHSGEEYENSSVRMVVGKVNLVEEISDLSTRQAKDWMRNELEDDGMMEESLEAPVLMQAFDIAMPASAAGGKGLAREKKIQKEALSDYYLYQVPGNEDIRNNHKIRMRSSSNKNIPVKNFYRYEPGRFGENVRKYLRFNNTEEKKLGKEPIPEGNSYVFIRNASGRLDFLGSTQQQYLPVGETSELSLGNETQIKVERKMMKFFSEEFVFDNEGNIDGYDEAREWNVKIQNFLERRIEIEVEINIEGNWDIYCQREFEKKDYRTVVWKLRLEAGQSLVVPYQIRHYFGQRIDKHE